MKAHQKDPNPANMAAGASKIVMSLKCKILLKLFSNPHPLIFAKDPITQKSNAQNKAERSRNIARKSQEIKNKINPPIVEIVLRILEIDS